MYKAVAAMLVIGTLVGVMMPSGKDEPVKAGSSTFAASSDDPSSRQAEPQSEMQFTDGNAIRLERQPDGHFYAEARVNGMPVRFLVDTGATTIALSRSDAQRAGIPFSAGAFETVGRGASGEVRGAFVTLGRVTLGNRSVENAPAAVIDGSEISLLGQSFLGRFASVEIKDDMMVLR